jgi:hypothetical protein
MDPEGMRPRNAWEFVKCVGMETYGNDVKAVYQWGKALLTNQPGPQGKSRPPWVPAARLAWGGSGAAGEVVGRAGKAVGRAAAGAHERGARARGIQTAYQWLQQTGGPHTEPDITFAGNKVTKGWSQVGRQSFRRGARLRTAAKWLKRGGKVLKWAGKANLVFTVGHTAYAAYKCSKK